jgi:hypothetical protein
MSEHITKLKSFNQVEHGLQTEVLASTPKEREKDREFVWVVIWGAWGALDGRLYDWDGDARNIVYCMMIGVFLGIVGGLIGEKYAGSSLGLQRPIVYWAMYWALFWVSAQIVLLVVFMMARSFLAGTPLFRMVRANVDGTLAALLLLVQIGTGKGILGGALGGAIRLLWKKRRWHLAGEHQPLRPNLDDRSPGFCPDSQLGTGHLKADSLS